MHAEHTETYLAAVGAELAAKGLTGEIVLAGGAMMVLFIRNRETTRDVDAYLASEPAAVREAASLVAQRYGLPDDWLNDAVKGFFFVEPPAQLWREVTGLRVYLAAPEYVFAMKAYAGRPEDVPDLQALRRELRLVNADEALTLVQRYIPERMLTARTQLTVESLFDDG